MYRKRDFELVTISADATDRKDRTLEFLNEQHASCKNFIFQGEYLENRDLLTESGWYAQAIYQPVPRWRIGARMDRLDLELDDPRRFTVMLDWSNSEFSRLRFQVARSEDEFGSGNEWALQYIHSIGAHGAHTF